MSDASPDSEPPCLEIGDPGIDASAIMAEIRRRVAERRQALGVDQPQIPRFDLAAAPLRAGDDGAQGEAVAALGSALSAANEALGQASTTPLLAPSPATRAPVVGGLWKRVRRQAHELALFYVNRSVTEQTAMNRHLIGALNALAALAQAQQRQIERLQAELAELRSAGAEPPGSAEA